MNKKYYKLPAAILSAGLSPRAVLLYAILADRSELSEKGTAFKDKKGTYIIFRIEEICTTIGVGERTAKYMLAELEDYGIIKRRKQGHGKPQKIYVQDIENMRKNATQEVQKTAPQEVQKTAPQEVQKTAPQEVQKTAPLINNTDNSNTDISSSSSGAEEEERDPAAALVKSVCNRYKLTPTKQIVNLTAERYKRTQTIYNAEKWILTTVQSLMLQEKTKPIKHTYAYDLSEYEKTSILDYDDEE